jgi:uncharacterized protein with GYD domain
MPKFLLKGNYNAEGAKGLVKEGGSARREAVKSLMEGLGGKIESFYYSYGEHDVYLICDFPDQASSVAVSLAVNSSGAVSITTVPLITPEEMDAACKKSVPYRAPGR